MTDINGIVTGIQGNPISSATPEDGYVLTWSETDGYWVARPPKKLNFTRQIFTTNGTWTAPMGITEVILIGYGGGGGGTGGGGSQVGGGGGSIQGTVFCPVVPGTTYNITIGAGGGHQTDGSDTTFGSLATFIGASHGGGTGGGNVRTGYGLANAGGPGLGGDSSHLNGSPSLQGYAGGNSFGTLGGGGAGPGGVGADANIGTGNSAAANTGAGGGCGSITGGTGGSGLLTVIF